MMITTLKGDISRLDFDVIVNPAGKDLMPVEGVCAQIFARAGQGLIDECQSLKGCDVAMAKLTKAYDLPCQAIIHVVVPTFVNMEGEKEILEACFWNACAQAYSYAREHELEQLMVAFPVLGSDRGYDKRQACEIGVRTIRKLFREYPDTKCIDVVFVCDDQEVYSYMKEELKHAIIR